MNQLFEIKVKLTENQKKNLSKAYNDKEAIVLRLTKDSLHGNDTLCVPATVKNRLERHRQLMKGMDIKLSKTNIRKQVGGSMWTSALSLGKAFGPTIAKTIGLSVLAGLASQGASEIVKSISGSGVGGFLVPNNKIDQLIAYKHLLTPKQKKDIINSLQTGNGVKIRPTKTQSGGALGTLLASIGIPMLINALTGSGAPRMGRSRRSPPTTSKKDGTGAPRMGRGRRSLQSTITPSTKKDGTGAPRMGSYRPPPFIGNWPEDTIGMGKKKLPKKRWEKDCCSAKTVHSPEFRFWEQYSEIPQDRANEQS